MTSTGIWPRGAEWVVLALAFVGLFADALATSIAIRARMGASPPSGPSGALGVYLLVAWVVPLAAALALVGWRQGTRGGSSAGTGPAMSRATRITLAIHVAWPVVLFIGLMVA